MMRRDRFLLVGSLIQFALFVLLMRWARKHRQPPIEVLITRLTQKKQSPSMRYVVQTLNVVTGSATLLNILVIPIAAILWKMRLPLEAVMTVITCWTGELVRQIIKKAVYRPRPSPLLVRVSGPRMGKSFPSGDVASSVGLWGWLLALGLVSKKETSGRTALLCIPAAFLVFIGPARIYLGAHWATDVLGGYLFGGGWLGLSLYLYLQWRGRNVQAPAQRSGKNSISSSHW